MSDDLVVYKKPSITDFTRLGLKLYHLTQNPESASLFKVEGKLEKDKDGFVRIPILMKEEFLQDMISPFIESGTLVIPEERSAPCPKALGKRKQAVKKLPSRPLKSRKKRNLR